MAIKRSGKRACAVAALVLAAGFAVHAATPPSAPAPRTRLKASQIRAIVEQYASRYGIPDRAEVIARVIHLESSGYPAARSKCGRYVGLCQFMPHTFRANVDAMKRAGLLDPAGTYSPLDPDQAIHVMVWMWSQGLWHQWGPARRMQMAQVAPGDRPVTPPSP